MPAKDLLHDVVVRALLKAGWIILSDQTTIRFNGRALFLDIIAEKDGQRIAIEIKGAAFDEMAELEKAIGQFIIYRFVLERRQPGTAIFLAVPEGAFEKVFGVSRPDGPDLATALGLNFLVFDPKKEEIVRWIQP